ncbi:MAG: toxin-antitoxin system YwqK family antitoxin [Bacteroidetes bacterium]|nr:MAG: toxin-antitoxin system YwqK family antitoxin [Bacteroidota bacterium]
MRSLLKAVLLILIPAVAAAATLNGQNRLDEQGRKTGPWKVIYPNGKIQYEATFREGRPVGMMVRYYDSGTVSARMMFDSTSSRSYARLYYRNGVPAAEGWYEGRVKDSVWTYYSESDGSLRIREPYMDGSLHGIVHRFYPGGAISEEVSWEENLKSGPWRQYYEDGTLRLESGYEKDLLQGPYRVYYPDSTLKMEGTYISSRSEGQWTYYDVTGEILYRIEYRNGAAVDQEKYHEMLQDSMLKFDPATEPGLPEDF